MNIEVQTVSSTRKSLTVSLDIAEVNAEYKKLLAEFSRQVRLPGFRPGKAPEAMVAKRFEKDILGELTNKLVNVGYRQAVEQEKLKVLGVADADAGQIGVGLPAKIRIEVDLEPVFELPNYKGFAVKAAPTEVTEAEIDQALENIRRERAEFNEVSRASAAGDYVRIKYVGTIDGTAIKDIAPDRPVFGAMEQTWEEAGSNDSLIPGFGAALIGLSKGDKKSVTVTFPETFQVEALRNKTGVYEVEAIEVRERSLPELNDAFYTAQGASSAEEFRKTLSTHIGRSKEQNNRAGQRQQVTEQLAAAITTEFPEALIANESRQMLLQFKQENLRRGVPAEEFDKRKDELETGAKKAAIDRLKVQFALARIAEQEKITVNNEDIGRVLYAEATRAGISVEKLAKDIGKDRDRVATLQRSILLDKALEFVVSQANVTTEAQPAAAS